MQMTIHCQARFAAAHYLTDYQGTCERMHGHNYRLVVSIKGPVESDGMVKDFKEVQQVVEEKILARLDHTCLNDIVSNPSAEHVAAWIWEELKRDLPLVKVTLYETDDEWVEYAGES